MSGTCICRRSTTSAELSTQVSILVTMYVHICHDVRSYASFMRVALLYSFTRVAVVQCQHTTVHCTQHRYRSMSKQLPTAVSNLMYTTFYTLHDHRFAPDVRSLKLFYTRDICWQHVAVQPGKGRLFCVLVVAAESGQQVKSKKLVECKTEKQSTLVLWILT